MHDPDVHKRSAFVIIGVLVAFYSLVSIVYFEGLRGDDVPCDDGGKFSGREVCYHAWKVLLLPLVAGIALTVAGLMIWKQPRMTREACLYPGTGVHTVLALLASFVLVPVLILLAVLLAEGAAGEPYTVTVGDTEYGLVGLVSIAILLGALPFACFAGLLLQQGRMRRRLQWIDREADPRIHPMELGRPASLHMAPVRDVKGTPAVYVEPEMARDPTE